MGVCIPIAREPYSDGGVIGRLSGHAAKHNAFARVKNLLVDGLFTFEAVRAIERETGIDVASEFRSQWADIFEEVVFHLGSDFQFANEERAFVGEYLKTFGIPRDQAEAAMRRAGSRILTVAIQGLISKGSINDRDVSELENAAKWFKLSPGDVREIVTARLRDHVNDLLVRMCEDGLVSDDEWTDFQKKCKSLRVTLTNLPEIESTVELARERWRVVFGEIRGTTCSDLTFTGQEQVYFRGIADWYEVRKVHQRIDYAGLRGSVRIARGLSFRYGSVAYRAPSVDRVQLIRTGEMVLTTKRVLFLAVNGDNKSIPWKSVVRVNINSHNEFELEKSTGKSPTFDVKSSTVGHQFLAGFLAQRLLCDVHS